MVEISTCAGPFISPSGAGMYLRIASNSGVRSSPGLRQSSVAKPRRADANRIGQSSRSSGACISISRSSTSSTTSSQRASGRSILLMHTSTGSFSSSALRRTKRVCGIGPSNASTSSITPSTIFSTRSTSPEKSAWPGVSTMLIFTPFQWMAVFLARMVIPRSRSMSPESITRSATCWLSRKMPLWRRRPSTSVVLPWSTWAMMAMLRISSRIILYLPSCSPSLRASSLCCSLRPSGWTTRSGTAARAGQTGRRPP